MDVRIIGHGNVLMGDDGAGPYAVRMLEATYLLPPDVTLVDASMPGVDLQASLIDADVAIVVDAVSCGEAGTVKRCGHCPLANGPATQCVRARREMREAFRALEQLRRAPKAVLLVAVVPQWIATGSHLSDVARRAAARAIDHIVGELGALGLHARPNPVPTEPAIWWDRLGFDGVR